MWIGSRACWVLGVRERQAANTNARRRAIVLAHTARDVRHLAHAQDLPFDPLSRSRCRRLPLRSLPGVSGASATPATRAPLLVYGLPPPRFAIAPLPQPRETLAPSVPAPARRPFTRASGCASTSISVDHAASATSWTPRPGPSQHHQPRAADAVDLGRSAPHSNALVDVLPPVALFSISLLGPSVKLTFYYTRLLISNLETLLSTAVAIMQVRKKEQRRASTLSMPEVVHLVDMRSCLPKAKFMFLILL
ncbi:uncharacterized protein [Lolium perenne]|uniref:uncharacterized protein n=1 Tax=Lolium perenne TaxID=4522 RepID=UPI0021F66AB3|nr:uncharacterized protein LOC127347631 [Lolium perenne]